MRPTTVAALLAVLLTAGCSSDDGRGAGPTATPEPATTTDGPDASDGGGTPAASEQQEEQATGPELAEVPASTRGWASSIGLPVVGAVRTSTPLARLGDATPAERVAVCTQVATELDGIASPQVLSALAVSADAETATLLVGDLRAKADLLAVCDQEGPEVDALVEEVAATHEVAVAWLAAISGEG